MRLAIREALVLLVAAIVLGVVYTAFTHKGVFADSTDSALASLATSAPAMISRDEARTLFDANTAFFVDARHAFDYKLGHIKGAINIPLNEYDAYKSVITPLPKDRLIVVYCDGAECNSSIELSSKLFLEGYSNVKIFFGGWREWESAQFPVERTH